MSNFNTGIGFLPGQVSSKFELGDTVKVEDAAWEMGIRDTFSLINKQSFVAEVFISKFQDNVFLNFVNPNVFESKKKFPELIPIKKEFIYVSKILLIEKKFIYGTTKNN